MPSSTKAAPGDEEAVERIGRIDRREGDGGAGGGEDARDVRGRDVGDAGENSRRRVHSPAAISAAASSPPRKTRTPGPIRPASIEYCTRKMPPSASASPPIQTTQLAPKRSSKLFAGSAGGAGGGGRQAAAPAWTICSIAASSMRSAAARRGAASRRGERRLGERLRCGRCGVRLRRGTSAPVQISATLLLQRGHAACAASSTRMMRDDRHDGGNEFHDIPRTSSARACATRTAHTCARLGRARA